MFFSIFSGADAKKLVEVQNALLGVIYGVGNVPRRIQRQAKPILNDLWSSSEDGKILQIYADLIKMMDASGSLVLGAHFVHFLIDKQKSDELVKTVKSYLLDQVVKSVISNKVKTPVSVLLSLEPLFKSIGHDDFKSILIPPMLKAMLRNPEVVMQSIAVILGKLSIDLSKYVQEVK